MTINNPTQEMGKRFEQIFQQRQHRDVKSNNLMKRCSTQLDTKEMQIKMTTTCHYSSIRIDKFKILTITKFW